MERTPEDLQNLLLASGNLALCGWCCMAKAAWDKVSAMIEWICGQWYFVKKSFQFYEDYTWQWEQFCKAYKKEQSKWQQ